MANASDIIQLFYTNETKDPHASLGGYPSATKVPTVLGRRANYIQGIRIVEMNAAYDLSGEANTGIGILRAASADSLAWTPPGGTEGDEVEIAYGETKVLHGASGNAYYHWIAVERVTDTDLKGVETIWCLESYCNLFSDVASEDAVSGTQDHRAYWLTVGDQDITSCGLFFIGDDAANWEVALETPSSGHIQELAVAEDHPSGVSWSGATVGSPFSIGALSASQEVGVWIRRNIAADTPASGRVRCGLAILLVSGGTVYINSYPSRYHVERDDAEAWGIWIGQDSAPSGDGDPDELFTDDPYTTTYIPDPGHTYYLLRRKRNKYGLWELNSDTEIIPLDDSGDIIEEKPSAAESVIITPVADGNGVVTGLYNQLLDEGKEADGFVFWGTINGATPDETDTPTGYGALRNNSGIKYISYDWAADALHGATIKGVVRMRRITSGDGTMQFSDYHQLDATGAGTVGSTSSIEDWAASGEAVIRKMNGTIREIVTYTSRTANSITVESGGRGLFWTSASAGESSDTMEPLAYVDSDSSNVAEAVVSRIAPAIPVGLAFFGSESAVGGNIEVVQEEPTSDRIFWVSVPYNIYITCERDNWAYFYADTQLIWAAYYSSSNPSASRFYFPSEVSVSESGSSYLPGISAFEDPIKILSWNGTKTLAVIVNYYGIPPTYPEVQMYTAQIDVAAPSISVNGLRENYPGAYQPQEIVLQIPSALCSVFSLWDAYTGAWIDYMTTNSGYISTRCNQIDNTLSQAEIEAL